MIYNPRAGQVNLAATIELVADVWRAAGWQVAVQPTQYAGHAVVLAQAAAKAGQRLVLAAGGDGTLGDVANGLARTATALAPLPVGTANSLARELALPRPTLLDRNRLLETAVLLLEGRLQQVDLGYIRPQGGKNGRYWLLWAGIGADSYLVSHIEPRPTWSKRLGRLGYILQAVQLLGRLPRAQVTLTVDGRVHSGDYLLTLLTNCRLYAGELLLNPRAQLDSGRFDILLLHGQGAAQALRYVWRIWRRREAGGKGIERLNGRFVTVQTSPNLPYQLDGDPAGRTPLTCELCPRALRLLVPQTTPTDLFALPGQPLADA